MKLIVGLGNPGEKFVETRHNIGFMVLDKLAKELGTSAIVWKKEEKHKAMVARVGDIALVKPLTFMNGSGLAVASIVNFYKLEADDVWVVHDDIDLPIGKIRIRQKGGSAGHNGVISIIQHLKTDEFVRFRLGIGRGMETSGRSMKKNWHHRAVIDFVLSRFRTGEAGALRVLVKNGAKAVRIALIEGLDKVMNRFN
ncbi:aminoacyl-tRNA hydrolase [Patescibacteria group bacterium]|nr:aminoacyl-tRNA hydrolase [Patescibacteria group bacterium]MBU1472976.1 aminoacyl-tRNA hydrolase [Patescibacteria group bacterium]MBU2459676.1 aminoacyl-tRNA hydrolase [Patescibacteria group bacterium]MBU2544588.1 aminoacyl-tRNA hydrolase [Patescibacteria group bacterium]